MILKDYINSEPWIKEYIEQFNEIQPIKVDYETFALEVNLSERKYIDGSDSCIDKGYNNFVKVVWLILQMMVRRDEYNIFRNWNMTKRLSHNLGVHFLVLALLLHIGIIYFLTISEI